MYEGIGYVRSEDVSLYSIHVHMDCSLIGSYRRWGCNSRVVVLTIATAKDVANASLQVFYVCGSRGRSTAVVHHRARALAYLSLEVCFAPDATAKVVGSIDIFYHPRITSLTNVCLGMTKNVGITSTAEGSVDAAVAQVHVGVTSHCSLKAAGVDILGCRDAVATSRCACNCALQVDGGAVVCVIAVNASFFLAYYTLLTSAEYEEAVAIVEVDGGRTPYLRLLTIASTEDAQTGKEYLLTLCIETDASIIYLDCFVFSEHLELGILKQVLLVYSSSINVDFYITIDMSAIVATTIYIATYEALQVAISSVGVPSQEWRFTCRFAVTIPQKLHRVEFQTVKVDLYLRIGCYGESTITLCIETSVGWHVGIITTAYELIIYTDRADIVEVNGTWSRHTTHVTTAEE